MPAQTVIYHIEVDPALIPDADLSVLLQALEDFEPVLESWQEQMQAGEKAAFASQGSNYGDPWAALAPSTVRERFRLGYGPNAPLVRTGNLSDAIGQAVSLTPDSVQVGVSLADAPYAAFLQNARRMPARLLVALTDDMMDAFLQTLRAYLAEATGGDLAGITIVTETT